MDTVVQQIGKKITKIKMGSCNKIFSSFIPCYEIKPVEGRINQFLDKIKNLNFQWNIYHPQKLLKVM